MLLLFDLHEKNLVYADEDASVFFELDENTKIPGKFVEKLLQNLPECKFTADEIQLTLRRQEDAELLLHGSVVSTGARKFVRIEQSAVSGQQQTHPLPGASDSFLEKVYDSALSFARLNQAENRLLISEKTMVTIFDAAVDGIVIINDQGIILGFNKAAEKIFKIAAIDAIGKDVTILMPEPHKSRHQGYIKRYLETGIPHIVGIGRKVQALRADGGIFPIDLAVAEVKLESGRIFTGFVRDLTEQIRLEGERNSFFQMSLDLFCILNPGGKIKNANPRWAEILGYTPEEIRGMSLGDFIHSDDLKASPDLIEEICTSSEVVGRTFRFRSSEGEFRWILWNSAFDKAAGVIYGVARDITEQRNMLEELEQARQEAERSSEARGMFIARMSHELRTPLNSIIGFSGILQKNLAGSFSDKDLLYLDRIRRNGNSLLKLINSILEFSRTESGFQEVNLEEVNVVDLIREIIDLMQFSIEESNVVIIENLPETGPTIRTDQIKLRQIIQNLIDNAVKFSADGQVEVSLFSRPEDNALIRLEIRDSGPGIAQEHLEVIFEAFQQCDNSVTRRFGGAGLGLAIASSFAELLGFSLNVDSEPGKGSCFVVNFAAGEEDHF